jgi:hypothetical protein
MDKIARQINQKIAEIKLSIRKLSKAQVSDAQEGDRIIIDQLKKVVPSINRQKGMGIKGIETKGDGCLQPSPFGHSMVTIYTSGTVLGAVVKE